MTGDLLYQCRRCWAVEPRAVVFGPAGSLAAALEYLTGGAPLPFDWDHGRSPRAVELHTCADGVTGVMDLVGGRAAGEAEGGAAERPALG